jgi:hypothetical protein
MGLPQASLVSSSPIPWQALVSLVFTSIQYFSSWNFERENRMHLGREIKQFKQKITQFKQ